MSGNCKEPETSTGTDRGRRRMPRMRALLGAVAVVGLLGAGLSTATASSAHAWNWSGTVKIAGNIGCSQGGVTKSPNIYIRLDNGETGWQQANWLGNYGVYFYRIPFWGIGGYATVTCYNWVGAPYSRTYRFNVVRPAFGDQWNLPRK